MRYIIGLIVALGMIGAIFFFIFRGGSNQQAQQQQVQRIDLTKYANTDATVQVITDGNIVADQNHKSYQISVNRTSATLQVRQGYNNEVIKDATAASNQKAFTAFIDSISRLGFTNVDSTLPKSEQGYCPLGQRYIFRLTQGDKELMRGWATSCGRQGNYKGDIFTIRNLFRQQIPDFNKTVLGSGLY